MTEDASGTPANWGAPVAVGEWRWPNLQERREVSVEPKAGRYVYFRRVTAWGWYGPQDPNYAAYGYPGYANANEVGVWEQLRSAATASDVDEDGLPDWGEDVNGDGLVSSFETSFENDDSDGDGLSDSAELMALGTNPLASDSDGDGNPDAPSAQNLSIFATAWPFGVETEIRSNSAPNNDTRVFYVPRGTDALHFNVRISTATDPSMRQGVKDTVFYRLSGTVLEKDVAGTCTIHELPADGSPGTMGRYLIDPHWEDIHDRMANRDGFLRVRVIAIGNSIETTGVTVGAGAVQLQLDLVEFLGGHTVKPDNGLGNGWSIWLDADPFDDNPTGTITNPVCYASGFNICVNAKWRMRGGGLGSLLQLRGSGSRGFDIPSTVATEDASTQDDRRWCSISNVESTTAFAAHVVDVIKPFEILWQFTPDGGTTWIDAGASKNQLYVTWHAPTTANLFHTVVDVACRNAVGMTDEAHIVGGIWSDFETHEVRRWDGSGPLRYWGPLALSFGDLYFSTAELCRDADGKCHAWARFMSDVLAVHGIGCTIQGIEPTGFIGFEIYSSLEGQGGPPLHHTFMNHAVVVHGGILYDPSYGRDYPTLLPWEDASVERFFDPWTWDQKGVQQTTLTPNP